MRVSSRNKSGRVLSLFAIVVVLPLAGCIAHAPGSGGGGGSRVAVAVTSSPASPASVPVSTATTPSSVQYTAAVTGTSNTAVTWSLSAASNGNSVCTATGAALGTITSTGKDTATYTAPTEVPVSPCGVAVTATSNEDNITAGQALVNVHVFVSIDPAPSSIGQGANLLYTATVVGAPAASQGVIWSASCPSCGSQQTAGAFDPNNPGLFIAPGLTTGTASVTSTINSTSNFDPTQSATTDVTVQDTDTLGSVSNVQTVTPCPADSNGGLSAGTCYSMTVTCDAIAPITAYLKVNPASAPVGTVLFLIGSGGSGLYDSNPAWQYGYLTVETVNNNNYNTVQVSFGAPFTTTQPNGWLQGPGGVRRLACRYATVADWIYNHPTNINLTNAPVPFCATANSGGSGALAYAALEYGLAGSVTKTAEFAMIEPTSGPVMSRLDQGCICNASNPPVGGDVCDPTVHYSMCYTPSEAQIIDSAYQTAGQANQPTLCSDGLTGTVATNSNRFISDSILWQTSKTLLSPKVTKQNARFGALDTTTAVPQGVSWMDAFGSAPAQACSLNASHDIPSDMGGAMDIANDILGLNSGPPYNMAGCK